MGKNTMINRTLVLFATTLALSSGALASNGMLINEARVFPNAAQYSKAQSDVLYYGGPVISHAQVYVIFWGSKVTATTKNAMPDFYASVLNSDYMDWLKVYNTTSVVAQGGQAGTQQTIGRGTYIQAIEINPAKVSGTLDDQEIRAELEKQILAKVIPAPGADSLYMIHFPKGLSITMHDGSTVMTSCKQFCAYHQGFKAKDGSNIYYGVMPDLDSFACSMGCGSGGSLTRITVSASHELIEAITDPFPTPGSNPSFPQAWNTKDGFEVGDLCQSNTATLKGRGASYTIQQEWDNSTHACTTASTYTSK